MKTKNIFSKIFTILFGNHVDANQKIILGFSFLTQICGSLSSPTITKTMVTAMPTRWLAFEGLVGSISALVFGVLWNNEQFRERSLPLFLLFELIESFAAIALVIWMLIDFNPWVFAISSLVYMSIISIWLGRIVNAYRVKLWKDRDREAYDNNSGIMSGASCLIGLGLACIQPPSLNISLILWGGFCFYNIAWIIVYERNKELLTKKE